MIGDPLIGTSSGLTVNLESSSTATGGFASLHVFAYGLEVRLSSDLLWAQSMWKRAQWPPVASHRCVFLPMD